MLKSLNQAGDTIVEVLVSLAILGLAIGISYATANRSLSNTRAAQENAAATELLQGQVETFRYLSKSLDYSTLPVDFCVDSSGVQTSTCSGLGAAGIYTVKINRTDPATDTFTFVATWQQERSQNGNDATVTMEYRVHQ